MADRWEAVRISGDVWNVSPGDEFTGVHRKDRRWVAYVRRPEASSRCL
jgi:hypothetical protein